jgi:dihydrodipicolinate synthase/N-acetylneuraminate lyase
LPPALKQPRQKAQKREPRRPRALVRRLSSLRTDDGESIDQKALLKTVDFQIENGVEGICLFGSTGGHGFFSDVEMTTATTAVVRHVNGRTAPTSRHQ